MAELASPELTEQVRELLPAKYENVRVWQVQSKDDGSTLIRYSFSIAVEPAANSFVFPTNEVFSRLEFFGEGGSPCVTQVLINNNVASTTAVFDLDDDLTPHACPSMTILTFARNTAKYASEHPVLSDVISSRVRSDGFGHRDIVAVIGDTHVICARCIDQFKFRAVDPDKKLGTIWVTAFNVIKDGVLLWDLRDTDV